MKNMKIEINAEQPLDDVVKELERLGFKRGCWWSWFCDVRAIEADVDTLHLVDYYSDNFNERHGEPTTLQQLREMQ